MIENLKNQNKQLNDNLNFTKSLLHGLLSAMDDISVICTDLCGTITYISLGNLYN